MVDCQKKISKEVYDRAMQNPSHYIAAEDQDKIFSISEVMGYGIYSPIAREINGEYYCCYSRGESCD